MVVTSGRAGEPGSRRATAARAATGPHRRWRRALSGWHRATVTLRAWWPAPRARHEVPRLLWLIIGVLLLFWLIGVATNVAGALIHILLAVVIVAVVLQLLRGRQSA